MEPKRPITPEELAKRRREYRMLHDSMVKKECYRAWKDYAMDGEEIPPPGAIQNLVQVWKVLWR